MESLHLLLRTLLLSRISKGTADTLIVPSKHLFRTRNPGCGRIWRDTNPGRYFLVRHSLGYVQHQGNGIVLWHVGYDQLNVLTFGNRWNTTVIRWQEETLLTERTMNVLITTFVGGERPPGDMLALPEHIDRQISGNMIQPGGEVLAILQTIPGDEEAHKHLLGHIIGILTSTHNSGRAET